MFGQRISDVATSYDARVRATTPHVYSASAQSLTAVLPSARPTEAAVVAAVAAAPAAPATGVVRPCGCVAVCVCEHAIPCTFVHTRYTRSSPASCHVEPIPLCGQDYLLHGALILAEPQFVSVLLKTFILEGRKAVKPQVVATQLVCHPRRLMG